MKPKTRTFRGLWKLEVTADMPADTITIEGISNDWRDKARLVLEFGQGAELVQAILKGQRMIAGKYRSGAQWWDSEHARAIAPPQEATQ